MQAYAKPKGRDIGEVVAEVDYEPADRGSPTRCHVVMALDQNLSVEQRRRLVAVAAKLPVHRTWRARQPSTSAWSSAHRRQVRARASRRVAHPGATLCSGAWPFSRPVAL